MGTSQSSHVTRGKAPTLEHEVHDTHGSQHVAIYRPALIVVSIRGEVRAGPDTNHITDKLSEAVASSPRKVQVFFDLQGFKRYDSEVRIRYTEALRKHSSRVERIHVFAESRMVRMGATVAGLVLPQLELLDRKAFESLLAAALAKL